MFSILLGIVGYFSGSVFGYLALLGVAGAAGLAALVGVPQRVYGVVSNFLFGSKKPTSEVVINPEILPDFPILSLDDDACQQYASLSSKSRSKFSRAHAYLVEMAALGLPASRLSTKRAHKHETYLSRRKVHSRLAYAGNWAGYKSKTASGQGVALNELKSQYLMQGDFPLQSMRALIKSAKYYNDLGATAYKIKVDLGSFSNPFSSNRLLPDDRGILSLFVKKIAAHVYLKKEQLVASMLARLELYQINPALEGDVLTATFNNLNKLTSNKTSLPSKTFEAGDSRDGILRHFPLAYVNIFAETIVKSGSAYQRAHLKVILSDALGIDNVTFYRGGSIDGVLFGISNKKLRLALTYGDADRTLSHLFSLEKLFIKRRYDKTAEQVSQLSTTSASWALSQFTSHADESALSDYTRYMALLDAQISALDKLEKKAPTTWIFKKLFWPPIKRAVSQLKETLTSARKNAQKEQIQYFNAIASNLSELQLDPNARHGLNQHIKAIDDLQQSLSSTDSIASISNLKLLFQARLDAQSGVQGDSVKAAKQVAHDLNVTSIKRALKSGLSKNTAAHENLDSRLEQLTKRFSKNPLTRDEFTFLYAYLKGVKKGGQTQAIMSAELLSDIQSRCLSHTKQVLDEKFGMCLDKEGGVLADKSNELMQSLKFLKLFSCDVTKETSRNIAKLAVRQLPKQYKHASSRNNTIRFYENIIAVVGSRKLKVAVQRIRARAYTKWGVNKMPVKFTNQAWMNKSKSALDVNFKAQLLNNELVFQAYLEQYSSAASVYLDVKALIAGIRKNHQAHNDITLTVEDKRLLGMVDDSHEDVRVIVDLLKLQDKLLVQHEESQQNLNVIIDEYNDQIKAYAKNAPLNLNAVLSTCVLNTATSRMDAPLNELKRAQGENRCGY